MIAADSSVAIAAFSSWHESHEAARRSLVPGATIVAHAALETYSVLTRLPAPHRAPAATVAEFIARRFPDGAITLDDRTQRELVPLLAELGVSGGAVYDGLIALAAGAAGATLLTLDERALATYRRCAADARLIES